MNPFSGNTAFLKTPRLVLAALFCAACGAGVDTFEVATAQDGDASNLIPGSLRIDVLPPSSEDGLLPQTRIFSPDAWQDGFTFSLERTIVVTGTVFGDVAHPWTGLAPTQPEPLSATLTVSGEDLLDGGAAVAEADAGGAFSLRVPAGEDYSFSVVPQNADTSPFYFETGKDFLDDLSDYSLSIEMGVPVYGRVTDDAGNPVGEVPLRVERLIDGEVVVAGATFSSDATGWYTTRILPVEGATFRVAVVEGKDANRRLFASRSQEMVLDPVEGAQVDMSVGSLDQKILRGDVVDADGESIAAVIRLSSLVLDDGGELTVETTTIDGTFYADVFPGTYQMEVYPPYEVLATPYLTQVNVYEEVVDLGSITLPAPAVLAGQLLDQGNDPVVGASISAEQVGFGGYRFKGVTGAKGKFEMEVPKGAFEVTFSPQLPTERGAITTLSMRSGEGSEVLHLASGSVVSGSITYDGAALAYAVVQVRDARDGALLGFGVTDENGAVALAVDIPDESTETADTSNDDPEDSGMDTGGGDTGGGTSGGDTGGDTSGGDTSGGDSSGDDTSSGDTSGG